MDQSITVENLNDELNRFSNLYQVELRKFLLMVLISIQKRQNCRSKLLPKNSKDYTIVKNDKKDPLWILVYNVIDQLDDKQSSSINHKQLEQCLIKLMIDIYQLTQLDHLFFNHWLWQTIIIVNNPNIRQILSTAMITSKKWRCWCWWLLLLSTSSMSTTLIDTDLEIPVISKLNHNLSSSVTKNKTAKTIIKITVNGKLITSTERTNNRINEEQPASVTILNKSDSSATNISNNDNNNCNKNPEYRTILQINNQLLELSEKNNPNENKLNDDDDNVFGQTPIANSNSERLTKFFRLSNPLNRSFLAKISPGTIRNHSIEHNDQLLDDITKMSNGLSSWPNDQPDENENKIKCSNNELNESIENKCPSQLLKSINIIGNEELIIENNHSASLTNKTNNMASNGHRNSFRNFSQSTLENIYEMFRNPFKSTKKRKKSAPSPASATIMDVNNHTKESSSNSSSKSLSEPNLSKSCKHKQNQRLLRQQKQQQQQFSQNSQCSVASTKTNSQNSLVNLDPDVDYSYQDNYSDIHDNHSKSTPQLITDNKQQNENLNLDHFGGSGEKLNREKTNSYMLYNDNDDDYHIVHNLFRSSWTGSWDRKLHRNYKGNIGNGINQRNSTRQSFGTGSGARKSINDTDDNIVDSNQIKFNGKI